MNILCIIPARSGSKGIMNKNIKILNGKPLIAWSIEQAKESKYIDNMRIIVSTDSQKYANIAESYGAEVPFLRPDNISEDTSTDYECIKHCVDWLKKNDKYTPDIIVHLRPTQPKRRVYDIDICIDTYIKNKEKYDSLRSVILFKKSPYKMYRIENEALVPLFHEVDNIKEPYNQCRQILPQCYLHNGYIDILKIETLDNGTISGDRIYPYVMKEEDNIDIDTDDDFNKINQNNRQNNMLDLNI